MREQTRSLEGWRELAEALPGVVGVQSGEAFVYVSDTLAAIAGVEPTTLVGEHWSTPFDRTEAARLEQEAIERARTDGWWAGEARLGTEDAADTTVELTLSSTETGALVWSIADPGTIPEETGRSARDESKPRARPGFARTVLDIIDDIVYVVDEGGGSYLWNQALVETTGYSHEEIAGMGPTDFVPADQREHVPRLMAAIDADDDRRIEVDVRTKAGDRITHEFTGSTFEDPVTGERFRCGIARDVTERKERERELRTAREFNEELVENAPFGMFRLDEELRITYENPRAREIIGLPDDEERSAAIGVDIRELPSIVGTGQADLFTRLQEGETIEFEFPFESIYDKEAYFTGRGVPLYQDGAFDGAILMAIDISERRRHERELERQRDELRTLDHINELLLETARELIQTSSRAAVERTVCERLATSDLYRFAWVGEREFDGDRIVPRTSAGEDGGYLDAVTITTDDSEAGGGPAGRAMRTGEVQVVAVDDPSFAPWREAASERGFESVAAVPLHHGETIYGVLVVYASREGAFSEREQAGFDVLGRTVGFVIHAARSRELLFAETVVELDFDIAGVDSVLVDVAATLECELTLDGYVPSNEQWILYVGVDGGSPTDVIETASEDPLVEGGRVIRDGEADGRIELLVRESSLLHTVTAAGATVRTAGADADGASMVVDAPVGLDVREVVEHVQSEYPAATLVAHREHNRDVTTVGRPGGLLDDLTDRQREALEAAYRARYFAWPRESTAEDVAESLDVAPPTLHAHLRKAEQAILARLLDDE